MKTAARESVSSTQEDYLEAILALVRAGGAARVRDLAVALRVHKSTVTAALRSLAEKRLVRYAPYERATLTPQGQAIAEGVTRNHDAIRAFLREVLRVDAEAAEANACRMEHVMDKDVLERLVQFAKRVRRCPDAAVACLSRHAVRRQA